MRLVRRMCFQVNTVLIVAVTTFTPLMLWATHASAAGVAVDAAVQTHQATSATTIASTPLSTANAGDLIVAFMTSDGPNASGGQSFASVTGGGLSWTLRERSNEQPGTAEIWQAVAPSAVSNMTVTATRASGSYIGSIVVVAFSGASTTTNGAVSSGSAATGSPTASLTATANGSWVWGVGDDWDTATARTVGSGQTMYDQYLASIGDTYWVQSQATANGSAGSTVTINDTAPTSDKWDLSTVEIVPAVVDTIPPSVPQNLTATAPNSNQVNLSWSASTDDTSVNGYYVFRNNSQIATTQGTTFTDTTVSPATSYTYTVEAFDIGNNISGQSIPATITTPAPSTNPPVISSVSATAITQSSATISWTTDIPSSSQVTYGTTSSYGSSTTLDQTQVTSHSQTLTNLSAGTTYHYQVVSTGSTNNTSVSPDATFATLAANVTLPDMQIKIPTNLISIGSVNGVRQLQYTHITWDAGTGPFEIDPTYNSTTGTATFKQAIYSSSSPGVWTYDYSVPVTATGIFHSPTDYEFPLTKFTLNSVNADGSIGAAVATSPKTDYCITGDTIVGGVPNTPNATFINASNCGSPIAPLGWSVGWGDQYDQTDSGQPISLAGVPDGTYILRGVVDPEHVLTESDNTNNVTDTKLVISGSTVTVISQTSPVIVPPTVSITSPQDGATVTGSTTLTASVSAASPATVASVQFLLDNQPLGNPITSAPYSYNWTIGTTPAGSHQISARVTDSAGNVNSASVVTVSVTPSSPPPDTTPPVVNVTNPIAGQTESGTVPLAANATDDTSVTSVQFLLDNQPLGSSITTTPYAMNWDTTKVANGNHTIAAIATDSAGLTTTSAPVSITVQNPAPPMTCFVLQTQTSAHGSGTVTTSSFHTAANGELLVAFVSADGPQGGGTQTATVTGAGLTWSLVKRQNAQSGDAEVWQATAPTVLSSATVKSTLKVSGFHQDLAVIAMEGVSKIGASAGASATSGAPSLSLTTTGTSSLVFAVGHDWDQAVARTLPSGWVTLDQWVDSGTGDTAWSQYTNTPSPAGTVVKVSDTAPTTDQWNFAAVELIGDAT